MKTLRQKVWMTILILLLGGFLVAIGLPVYEDPSNLNVGTITVAVIGISVLSLLFMKTYRYAGLDDVSDCSKDSTSQQDKPKLTKLEWAIVFWLVITGVIIRFGLRN